MLHELLVALAKLAFWWLAFVGFCVYVASLYEWIVFVRKERAKKLERMLDIARKSATKQPEDDDDVLHGYCQ